MIGIRCASAESNRRAGVTGVWTAGRRGRGAIGLRDGRDRHRRARTAPSVADRQRDGELVRGGIGVRRSRTAAVGAVTEAPGKRQRIEVRVGRERSVERDRRAGGARVRAADPSDRRDVGGNRIVDGDRDVAGRRQQRVARGQPQHVGARLIERRRRHRARRVRERHAARAAELGPRARHRCASREPVIGDDAAQRGARRQRDRRVRARVHRRRLIRRRRHDRRIHRDRDVAGRRQQRVARGQPQHVGARLIEGRRRHRTRGVRERHAARAAEFRPRARHRRAGREPVVGDRRRSARRPPASVIVAFAPAFTVGG